MRDQLLTIETNLSTELVELIDARLEELTDKWGAPEVAELLGYYDSMEHLTGLGFVACQSYVTAIYGILGVPKRKALRLGPNHGSGSSVATIVNAAANYWKHNHEWHMEKSSKRREAIEAAFDEVGFPVGTEYPLSGVLTELSVPGGASFRIIMRQ